MERHIYRTLTALGRHYAAREALGTLSEEDAKDRDRCAKYRESISLVRILWVLVPCLVAALIIGKTIISLLDIFVDQVWGLVTLGYATRQLSDDDRNRISDSLDSIIGAFGGGPGGLVDAIMELANLGRLAGFLALIAVLLAYLVSRPFVPMYRMKRRLLCTADRADCGVLDVPVRWYVNKSTGAYRIERETFAILGSRPPSDHHADLWILAIPVVIILLFALWWLDWMRLAFVGNIGLDRELGYVFGAYASWLLALACLRVRWLFAAARGRRGDPSDSPFFGVTVQKFCLVARSPIAVASLPIVVAAAWPLSVMFTEGDTITYSLLIAVLGPWLLVLPVWWRLQGNLRYLAAGEASSAPAKLTRRSSRAALFVLLAAVPIAANVCLWWIAALMPSRSGRYLRFVAVTSGVLLVPAAWYSIIGIGGDKLPWWASSLGAVVLGYSGLFYLIQRTQNTLIRRYSETVRYDPC